MSDRHGAANELSAAKSVATSEQHLEGEFVRLGPTSFGGHLFDASDHRRRFVVELVVDGIPCAVARADRFVRALALRGVGNGCYGFSIVLDDDVLADGSIIQARVANLDRPVGKPVALDAFRTSPHASFSAGAIQWDGGLRFHGWLAGNADGQCADIFVDGERIDRVSATGWGPIDTDRSWIQPARSFDLHLPDRFADGRVHRVSAAIANGALLDGSPLAFVAFEDGLASAIEALGTIDSERLRGQLFDRLVPMSWPFTKYDEWRKRFPVPGGAIDSSEIAVVIVGPGDVHATRESLIIQRHQAWVAMVVAEADEQARFDPRQVNDFLASEAQDCTLVVFCLAGTRLDESALDRVAGALNEMPHAKVFYGDVDVVGNDGSLWPAAFPAFDFERALEQGYGAHLFALHRDEVATGFAAGASDLYALFFAAVCAGAENSIVHLPGSLGALPPLDRPSAERLLSAASKAYLISRNIDANVLSTGGSMFPAVAIQRLRPSGGVTVVISTCNFADNTLKCIESICPGLERVGANLIVVTNASPDAVVPDVVAALETAGGRLIHLGGGSNLARLRNRGAEAATGDFLCFLDDHIEALEDQWLNNLLGRLADPSIDAVGAMLINSAGLIEHAGYVLGQGFAAGHAFFGQLSNDPGYTDLLSVAHGVSAVSAACLVVRQAAYCAVGGMDDVRFPHFYGDVDFCLRLRAGGSGIVMAPRTRLLATKAIGSRAPVLGTGPASIERELHSLRACWGEALMHDSFYSPILSLDAVPFSALAWPPRGFAPRFCSLPQRVDCPLGW